MKSNVLQDIIARCHLRHEKPLKQQKTISEPALYKGLPYHYTVYCAHKYPVMLQDLEIAGLSFMPIGQAPGTDRPPRHFGGERFLKRQQATEWDTIRLHRSWGIQVYTGTPSACHGAPWHDINFKYEALCAAPDDVLACVQALVDSVANPLLTITKSGGLRFSCRIPGYLHPNTNQERLYIYKQTSTVDNSDQHNSVQHEAYIEILGDKGYSCWDARYEILFGDLLDPPMVSKEVFFAPIDALRAMLHEHVLQSVQHKESVSDAPYSLGSCKLDLAKEAFLKRGFFYVRESGRLHYWSSRSDRIDNTEISLWENEGGVWIRASTSDTELPMKATLITDVWNDTGILPPIPATGLAIDDKTIAVREGKLSPLAIKRPTPVLHKSNLTEKIDETREEVSVQIRHAFDRNVRVLGIIPETDSQKNRKIESYLQNSEVICLNVKDAEFATKAEQFFQKQNVGSVLRWRDRMYLWDQVKDIPVNTRMATPFEHGNVCEDPERCEELEKKGGNPSETICPQCHVYAACKEHGYLSQSSTLQTANTQIIKEQLLLDPQYAKIVEQLLKARNETQWLCIINATRENRLFLECELSKTTLKEWIANWQGDALGNFAIVLLNALEIRDKSHANSIKRLRTVIRTFEWLEKEIIQQMCHVNVRGKVVTRGVTNKETGEELARFTIEFERGISAYIPLDAAAADKLLTQDLSFFQLHTFVPNENINILMPISDAVKLGLLDAATVENIQEFPTVCEDPSWTFWHQIKRFFAHYMRDADAPMQWEDEVLRFWIPPVLHPSVRHLLVTAPVLHNEHFRRTFSDSEIEILRTQPVAWNPGNRVFQIRTDIYPRHTIVDTNNTWDVFGVSKIGQHIFWRIQDEIEKDPNIQHGIIVHPHAIEQLKDIESIENVCFLTIFREIEGLETAFQKAQVIWAVGMPDMGPRAILKRSQMFFGNDAEPLSYEMEPESYRYKDERVQSVYEITVFRIFTEIIELAQLNRLTNKKVVLITGLQIPGITDRPETLLFDWEDFDVAGGLDKLAEVIATRQRFETERDNLTSESSRKKVEEVLGCSPRQANRVLQRMRGGKLARVSFREQILALLADGEKKTPEFVETIQGHPKAINTELTRLVNTGDIVKIKRGVYTLPEA